MREHGHELLYTPPFQPEVQPIELLWGKVKKEVARQNIRGRTIQQTKSQVQAALRSTGAVEGARYFHETDKRLEEWVREDEELLQFGSFAAMIASPALAYKTPSDTDELDDEHSEDSNSEDEENETSTE